MADAGVEVAILTGGDALRRERLTRSLFDELSAVDGLDVRFVPEAAESPGAGAKGGGMLADASLWVFLTASVQAGSRVLLAAIQAWSEREKHRVVRLTMGDRTIEISSSTTQSQERLVDAFLHGDEP